MQAHATASRPRLPASPSMTADPTGPIRHLFVTVDYPPALGGMARRHVEICRRLAPDPVTVSTVSAPGDGTFDAGEAYAVHRQPFAFGDAKLLPNLLSWARWLVRNGARFDLIHSANLRPSGYPALWAARRRALPFLLYVNGADVLLERRKAATNRFTRAMSRRLFGRAAVVVANSAWTARQR